MLAQSLNLIAVVLTMMQTPAPSPQVPTDGRNLALGRPYTVAPQPNCASTVAGDQTDLTDGKISSREDFKIWSDPAAISWEYTPLLNIEVDLGSVSRVSEIGARFLGGSAQPSLDFPTFVTAVASLDGQRWFKVASYDSHRWSDEMAFGVPQTIGKAWVHALRFKNLSIRARFVGLIVGGSGLTCSDELWVLGEVDRAEAIQDLPRPMVEFATKRPQIAGLREIVTLAEGLVLPVQLLLLDESRKSREVRLTVELTQGVRFRGLEMVETLVTPSKIEERPGGLTSATFVVQLTGRSAMPWTTLLLEGRPELSNDDVVRLTLTWSDGGGDTVVWSVKPVRFEPVQPARRMMFSLAWWRQTRADNWPGFLDAMKRIGINTTSTLEDYIRFNDQEELDGLDAARQQGFKVMNVFSTFHGIISGDKVDPEVYCQGPDGPIGKQLCPSYRGRWYQAELDRLAVNTALLKPNYISMDVEVWNWAGPTDSERCTRCNADKAGTGLRSWDEWRAAKGFQMWSDAARRVHKAAKGVGGPPVALGSYDFRPGTAYQQFWPVDQLLKTGLIQSTQCSVYTPLRPLQIAYAGDQARQDRQRVPRTCGMPWATPGDTGILNSEQMRCGLLEYFLNGSCGIHFWSDRYWDGETLLGLHLAIKAVTPVEDIILDGRLSSRAGVAAPARVSAMESESGLAILVARYEPTSEEPIKITIDLPWDSLARDCETGQSLGTFRRGSRTIELVVGTSRSRLVEFRRAEAPTPESNPKR